MSISCLPVRRLSSGRVVLSLTTIADLFHFKAENITVLKDNGEGVYPSKENIVSFVSKLTANMPLKLCYSSKRCTLSSPIRYRGTDWCSTVSAPMIDPVTSLLYLAVSGHGGQHPNEGHDTEDDKQDEGE